MSARDTVMGRVRKLLAGARSPSIDEAEVTALKAQEALQQYHLEESAAAITTTAEDVEVASFDYAARAIDWQRNLGFAIARGCFCKAVHTPRGTGTTGRSWLYFVGRSEDVGAALAVYEYLRGVLKRLAREEFVRYLAWAQGPHEPVTVRAFFMAEPRVIPPPDPHPDPAAWKADFCAGAVWGLDGCLRDANRAFEQGHPIAGAIARVTGNAIDRRIAASFHDVRQSPMGRPIKAFSGWVAGLEAVPRTEPQKRARVERGAGRAS